MNRVERWLDQGLGSCVLKEPGMAQLIVGAMHFFNGQHYERWEVTLRCRTMFM